MFKRVWIIYLPKAIERIFINYLIFSTYTWIHIRKILSVYLHIKEQKIKKLSNYIFWYWREYLQFQWFDIFIETFHNLLFISEFKSCSQGLNWRIINCGMTILFINSCLCLSYGPYTAKGLQFFLMMIYKATVI